MHQDRYNNAIHTYYTYIAQQYPGVIAKLNQIRQGARNMLSCLLWLTSGSTTNGIQGSGSTDSVGSTGSTSDGSVTIMHECDAKISMMP